MKKSVLKGIAFNILDSFASRNNDIGGYWGIGVLYNAMEDSKLEEIEIDLFCSELIIRKINFNNEVIRLKNILKKNLGSFSYPIYEVRKLSIHIKRVPNIRVWNHRPPTHLIMCNITIELFDQRIVQHQRGIYCNRHSPLREYKSMR